MHCWLPYQAQRASLVKVPQLRRIYAMQARPIPWTQQVIDGCNRAAAATLAFGRPERLAVVPALGVRPQAQSADDRIRAAGGRGGGRHGAAAAAGAGLCALAAQQSPADCAHGELRRCVAVLRAAAGDGGGRCGTLCPPLARRPCTERRRWRCSWRCAACTRHTVTGAGDVAANAPRLRVRACAGRVRARRDPSCPHVRRFTPRTHVHTSAGLRRRTKPQNNCKCLHQHKQHAQKQECA